jgi:hypothetical protein
MIKNSYPNNYVAYRRSPYTKIFYIMNVGMVMTTITTAPEKDNPIKTKQSV